MQQHSPENAQRGRATGHAACSCRQGFYITLPVLHGVSALTALVICFYCDVGAMSHQARVPRAPPMPGQVNASIRTQMFLAAYKWAEDAPFETHTWNPFALAMVFQWLTAGFALRNLEFMAPEGILATVWYAWLAAGYAMFLIWSFVQPQALCVAMLATVTASFIASAVICYIALGPPKVSCHANRAKPDPTQYAPVPAAEEGGPSAGTVARVDGRIW